MSVPYRIAAEIAASPAFERSNDALLRLDERLKSSPFSEGFASRADFHEACATRWMQGELVHLEDLVLLDANTNRRMVDQETSHAWTMVRMRRLARRRPIEWLMSDEGILGLESTRRARGGADDHELDELIYEPDWNEAQRLLAWRTAIGEVDKLPALIGAAVAWDQWLRLEPIQHGSARAGLMAALVLRSKAKTKHHLAAIDLGGRHARYRRAGHHQPSERIMGFLEWVETAASVGYKELDRLSLAHKVMSLKLTGRRKNSRLRELVDLFISHPVVTVPMAAKALRITTRAADLMIREIGSVPRELTGRGRYKAWGVL